MRRLQRGGWPYSQPPNVSFQLNKDSPQAKGLVAWWPTLGSVGSNVLRDFAGRRLDGTFQGPGEPAWTTMERGPALSFDGNNDEIHTTNDLTLSGSCTYVVWIKTPNAWSQNYPTVMSQRTADGLTIIDLMTRHSDLADVCRFQVRLGGVWRSVDDIALAANTVYLLAGAIDVPNVRVRIYRDGIERNDAAGHNAFSITRSVYLGVAGNEGGAQYYNGLVLEARIYDRLLTAAEHWQLYANPWELYQPLIRRWPGWKSPVVVRVPRYGFTNFQVPGIV